MFDVITRSDLDMETLFCTILDGNTSSFPTDTEQWNQDPGGPGRHMNGKPLHAHIIPDCCHFIVTVYID